MSRRRQTPEDEKSVVSEAPEFGMPQIIALSGSALLHLAYFLTLQTGYRNGDLSLVYPTARAPGPFLSTAFAIVLLAEKVTVPAAGDAAAVICGVAGMTGGFSVKGENLTRSLIFGAGILIGSYTVWDVCAVSVLLIPTLLLDYVSSLSRGPAHCPHGQSSSP